jgi:hypothetical protein
MNNNVDMLAADIRHTKANLHSAEAALVTARQRLTDAEDRFAADVGCSRDFAALIAPNDAVGWWRSQVRVAECIVAECEDALSRAIASQGSVSCQN